MRCTSRSPWSTRRSKPRAGSRHCVCNPPTNTSFHLKTLTHAGLVSVEQEGRFQRYRANLSPMRELIAYLTAECCDGMPERCEETRGVACGEGLEC